MLCGCVLLTEDRYRQADRWERIKILQRMAIHTELLCDNNLLI